MTYGSGDLTLLWEALVAGNLQSKKAKFRQLTRALWCQRRLIRRSPLVDPNGEPGGVYSQVHS